MEDWGVRGGVIQIILILQALPSYFLPTNVFISQILLLSPFSDLYPYEMFIKIVGKLRIFKKGELFLSSFMFLLLKSLNLPTFDQHYRPMIPTKQGG